MNTLSDAREANYASGALFAAAQRGQVDRVTALLAAADTREITVQEEMHGALCIAIRNDFPAVVRVLCAADFRLAFRTWDFRFAFPVNEFRETRRDFQPIHLAASVGSASCIAELVSRFQVSAGARDGFNDTPLHWACRFAHVDAIRKLLAIKADVDNWNDNRDTPLNVCADYGHIRCVKALVASQLEEAVLQSAARQQWYYHQKRCAGLLARALRLHKAAAAE